MDEVVHIGNHQKQCKSFTKKLLQSHLNKNLHVSKKNTEHKTKRELCLLISKYKLETKSHRAAREDGVILTRPSTDLDDFFEQHGLSLDTAKVSSQWTPKALGITDALWWDVLDNKVKLVPVTVLKELITTTTTPSLVKKYTEDIRENGLREPLQVAIVRDQKKAYLTEGHHRLGAMINIQKKLVPTEIIYVNKIPKLHFPDGVKDVNILKKCRIPKLG